MSRRTPRAERRRAGMLAPALLAALLTLLLVTAVVLNLLWRRSAARSLSSAADASALAAVRELACDERLLDGPLPDRVRDRSAVRAIDIAARHRAAGFVPVLAADELHLGNEVVTDDGIRFLDTAYRPNSASVMLGCRGDGFFPWLVSVGGNNGGFLVASATATLDDHIAALRPRVGGRVKVWPLAVREKAPAGSKERGPAGWAAVIGGAGPDEYGYDADSGQVVRRPDGLHELVVRSLGRRSSSERDPDKADLTAVDLGQTFRGDRLVVALRDGLSSGDLGVLGGVVPVASLAKSPEKVEAKPQLPQEFERGLRIGDARPLFVFNSLAQAGRGRYSATLNGVVAARLMDFKETPDGGWQATLQPAVVTCGSALTAATATPNRYLLKPRLTR